MEPFAVDDLVEQQRERAGSSIEFLRQDSLSMEIYRLPAGSEDPQEPHTEDEVYYVVDGQANIRIADETYPVEAGDVVFVERDVEHCFFDIEVELVTLVFFAPARERDGAAGTPSG